MKHLSATASRPSTDRRRPTPTDADRSATASRPTPTTPTTRTTLNDDDDDCWHAVSLGGIRIFDAKRLVARWRSVASL
jgi:hypothetical protein